MRKPRDIDAELQALATKAKQLKSRKITQLGELIIATGADALEPDLLAGVLLSALETKAAATRSDWRARGEAFFRKGEKGKPQTAAHGGRSSAPQNPRPDTAR